MVTRELILKRKSIRKYDMTELGAETLESAAEFLKNAKPLTENDRFDFKIVGREEFFEKTGGMFRISAPHYVMFFCDGSDASYRNIGFIGEQLALSLAGKNIGTCWLGGAKSKESLGGKGYAISIAFGKPLEDFRKSADEFKRKSLTDIAAGFDERQKEVLECVRLAPSAVNGQPWYFKCESGVVHIFKNKGGGMSKMIAGIKTMQKIDIGIAISHFGVEPFVYENLNLRGGKMTYEGSVKF